MTLRLLMPARTPALSMKSLFPARFFPTTYHIRANSSSASTLTPTPQSASLGTHAPGATASADTITRKTLTANDITFPWLRSKDPPRLNPYPYPPSPFMQSLITIFPISVQRFVSNWAVSQMIRTNTSAAYFPDRFLLGATLAARELLSQLSQSTPSSTLENILAPDLHTLLTTELSRLHALSDPPLRLHLSLPNIYDASIRDSWVSMGPRFALSGNLPRDFTIVRWMTMTFALRRLRDDDSEVYRSARDRAYQALIQGCGFRVDVEIDADVEYKILDGSGNAVIDERGRRVLLVSFETPYFEPAERMTDGQAEDSEESEPPIRWCWMVSDIDYIIETERLKKMEALAKEREERLREKEREE